MKVIFVILLTFFSVKLFSQTVLEQGSLFNDLDRESPKYSTSMEQYYKTRSSLRTIVPQILEKELEDAQYQVGPGDQFRLFIYGELENVIDFMVLPEGQVYIPTIGKIDLKNLNLEDAKKKIVKRAKELYIKADISVNISSLRKFRTYLIGEVTQPGTYFVQGSNRVSDILEIAGGVEDWADLTEIELRHADNSVDTLNIMRFYRNGDKNENPFVVGGDMIFIPTIDLTKPYVLVESKLEKALGSQIAQDRTITEKSLRKIYQLLENETVISFLNRISAFSAEIDLTKITLVRDSKTYILDLLNKYSEFNGFSLQTKDLLIIPSLLSRVYVQGEVRRPGSYTYDVNLTANDYAGMAGVLEIAKPSSSILVIRRETGEVLKGGYTIVEKGDTIIVPRKFREDMRDYMTILLPILSLGFSLYLIVSSK